LLILFHSAGEEPFMVFSLRDAAIQVGGSLVVLAAWIAWFLLALTRRRMDPLLLIAIACLGALHLLFTGMMLFSYFQDLWGG